MATILKDTMTKEIGGGQKPSELQNFKSVMRDISRETYSKRLKTDKKSSALSGVKASDISGGAFDSIMKSLEELRGGDISKEYAAGVKGYSDTLDAMEKQKVLKGIRNSSGTKPLSQIQMKANLNNLYNNALPKLIDNNTGYADANKLLQLDFEYFQDTGKNFSKNAIDRLLHPSDPMRKRFGLKVEE